MPRETKELTGSLRIALVSGKYRADEYLPPVRDLCTQFGVSFETVRRGLKTLEQEGLLTSEARQGFRVASKGSFTSIHCPVAYVTNHLMDLSNAQPANWAISQALTAVAAKRGKPTLGVHVQDLSHAEILARLEATPHAGIVLDTLDERLLRLLEKPAQRPLVMVNSWFEHAAVNVVLQDNYRGGFLAARWLAEAGAERVAWLGPIGEFGHTRERFAGVVAGLASLGRKLPHDLAVETNPQTVQEAARALLRRRERPDGVAVFTKLAARAMRDAAQAEGLEIGKDLLMIGWTVEDCFETEHHAVFAGGPVPPAVVWRAKDMAEAALDILAANQSVQITGRRVLVSTRLKFVK